MAITPADIWMQAKPQRGLKQQKHNKTRQQMLARACNQRDLTKKHREMISVWFVSAINGPPVFKLGKNTSAEEHNGRFRSVALSSINCKSLMVTLCDQTRVAGKIHRNSACQLGPRNRIHGRYMAWN